MGVDLDKNLDKDVYNTIKTASGYPPELAWDKISYVNVCKLIQIMKKLIILGRLCLSGYPSEFTWNKISYVNFCKLTQIMKILII